MTKNTPTAREIEGGPEHQCGGPQEPCCIPGCPECRHPTSASVDNLNQAEAELVAHRVFNWDALIAERDALKMRLACYGNMPEALIRAEQDRDHHHETVQLLVVKWHELYGPPPDAFWSLVSKRIEVSP